MSTAAVVPASITLPAGVAAPASLDGRKRATTALAVAPSHLHAVDVVRLATVVGVIAVHSVANTIDGNTLWPGLTTTMLHVTREVFLFLSAFVLAYSYRSRPLEPGQFWKRRYPLVALPYVTWTLVYALVHHLPTSPRAAATTLLWDLATGRAEYHLYFLVVTLQLYAVFPWLLRAARRIERRATHVVAVLIVSVTLQLGLTASMHYGSLRPGVLDWWFSHASVLLPSYQLYIVAGLLCALRYEAITEWVQAHRRLIAAGALGMFALGVASYLHDVDALGMRPVQASEVFQPVVVLESVAAILGQFAVGLWIAERVGSRGRRRLESSSDVSFGVYLIHPLLLTAAVVLGGATGVSGILAPLPIGVKLALLFAAFVPGLYALTAVVAVVFRQTPLSIALTGRSARRRLSSPQARAAAAPPQQVLTMARS